MGTWGHTSGNGRVAMSTVGSLIEMGGFISYIYSETPLTFSGLDKPMIEMGVEASKEELHTLMQGLQELKREHARLSQ